MDSQNAVKEKRRMKRIANTILVVCFLLVVFFAFVIFRSNRDYYSGPYQEVLEAFYEDVIAVEGIDFVEIRYEYEENRGNETTTIEISGEGAEKYLNDTTFFETAILPHLCSNNNLMTAINYSCANDCDHIHMHTGAGSIFQIRINNQLYAQSGIEGYSTSEAIIPFNYFRAWECAGEVIYLSNYSLADASSISNPHQTEASGEGSLTVQLYEISEEIFYIGHGNVFGDNEERVALYISDNSNLEDQYQEIAEEVYAICSDPQMGYIYESNGAAVPLHVIIRMEIASPDGGPPRYEIVYETIFS